MLHTQYVGPVESRLAKESAGAANAEFGHCDCGRGLERRACRSGQVQTNSHSQVRLCSSAVQKIAGCNFSTCLSIGDMRSDGLGNRARVA